MSKRVLVIASDFPYPPNHGGRVDMFERLKALSAIGCSISLVSTIKEYPSNENELFIKKYVNNNFFILRNSSIVDALKMTPYQISSRNNLVSIKSIIETIKDLEFDACFIEGHYCLDLYRKFSANCNIKEVFLRVHNDETKYFMELSRSTNNILKKIFYFIESIKFGFFEKKFFAKKIIEKCLHISNFELNIYKKKYPYIKNIFLPASVDVQNIKSYKKNKSKTVLFLGSLFMPNNIEGLKWYIGNIHERLCIAFSDYRLIVAGNTRGVNVESIMSIFKDFSNIDFFDSPDNLDDIYDKACIFINPMLSGAGVKLKTIDAVKNALPVVSTPTGNEGTGLVGQRDILIGKDDNEFFNGIALLLDNEKLRSDIVASAQKFIINNYNQESKLTEILNGG